MALNSLMPFSRMLRFGDNPNEIPEQSEYEFGTNTGRQGIFNPAKPDQRNRALQRLMELHNTYGERLAPNFSGETGVSDLTGYSQMKNAQTEAQNIQNILQGGEPMRIRFDPRQMQTQTPGRSAITAHRAAALKALDATPYSLGMPDNPYSLGGRGRQF